MLKRGTPDHPKTHKLARLLNIPRCQAVGLLEMLWHWTARFAIQGDIGRWSDDEIAAGAGWEDFEKSREFVTALVEAEWLDVDPIHRLLIHDWSDHADESVRKTLKNRGLQFLPENSRKIPEQSRKGRPKPEPEPVPEPVPLSNPVQSLPSVETSQTGVRERKTVQSSKTEQPGSARSPTKFLAADPNGGPDREFENFWALFCGAGVELNEHDRIRTYQRWLSIADSERPKILPWAIRMFKTKWRTHFTPMPFAALESEGWTRTKGPRLIPEPDPKRARLAERLEEELK